MTLTKYILFAIELLGLLVFLFPLFRGQINMGNILGIAFFLLCAAATYFSSQLGSLIAGLWQKLFGKVLVIAVFAVIALGVLLAFELSYLMIKAQTNEPVGQSTVIVLGCKVRGEKPSKMLRYRLDAAYEYLSQNEDAVCIVSGGKGKDEEISEAECMYNYLTEKGISEDRIYKEDQSESTAENLAFSKKIIEDSGLCEDITIVTDGFHEYRASYIAKKAGYKTVYAYPAKTELLYLPTYWVREWAAILQQVILRG